MKNSENQRLRKAGLVPLIISTLFLQGCVGVGGLIGIAIGEKIRGKDNKKQEEIYTPDSCSYNCTGQDYQNK